MSTNQPNKDRVGEVERLRARIAELESAEAQRRQEESILRDSEQLYRSLVETSQDCIGLADLEGHILMANQQAAVLHGYARAEDMLGINILELVSPEAREAVSEDIRQVIQKGSMRDRRHLSQRRDGSTFLVEASGTLIRDPQGGPKYILYNGRDITARDRLQQETIESQKLESIGRLAGGIAHDFNNALAVILGNASLQMRNQSLPPNTLECLKEIICASERASSLTSQLLAYARGGLRRAVPTDANVVVKSAWEMLRRTSPPQIELVLKLGENLPQITVDTPQIQQVIINLCMNAIQASTLPNRVEIGTTLETVSAHQAAELNVPAGKYVAIRVEDHGCGMDAATIERIFEPFFTTKSENRGMGLSASLGIAQGHGGQLVITSQLGQGTQATVWLPVEIHEDTNHTMPASTWANPPKGAEAVLVVDDDPGVSKTAEQILSSLGYCVVTRNDSDEALAFLDTNGEDLDLVVLNVNMPKRTAEQMLVLVLRKCPGMKVLLTSGIDSQEAIQPLLGRGATAFLPKPFSLRSLAQAVRNTLDAKWD